MSDAGCSSRQRPSARSIVGIAGTMVLLGAIPLLWPFVSGVLHDRATMKAYRAADDTEQARIVQAYLALRSAQWPEGELFFDTASAALCPIGKPEPCDELEPLFVGTEDGVFRRDDAVVPEALRHRLIQLVGERTWNQDPDVSGVTTLRGKWSGSVADLCGHDASQSVKLLRISRAAINASDGMAIAMTLTRYCDKSSGSTVIRLQRHLDTWTIVEEY